MLYWFGVYALVIIAVLLPFLVLYMAVAAFWFGPKAIRFVVRRLKSAVAVQTGLSREQRSDLATPGGDSPVAGL